MNSGVSSGARPTSSGSGLALNPATKQVIAFYVGDRSRQSAERLWRRIPRATAERAIFYTDDWEAYRGVFPEARHRVCAKGLRPDQRG